MRIAVSSTRIQRQGNHGGTNSSYSPFDIHVARWIMALKQRAFEDPRVEDVHIDDISSNTERTEKCDNNNSRRLSGEARQPALCTKVERGILRTAERSCTTFSTCSWERHRPSCKPSIPKGRWPCNKIAYDPEVKFECRKLDVHGQGEAPPREPGLWSVSCEGQSASRDEQEDNHMTSVMQSLFKPTAATVNWDAGNNLRL